MKKNLFCLTAAASVAFAGSSQAMPILTLVDDDAAATGFIDDGVINAGEYSATFSNGGGDQFGGTVGNGSISVDTDGTNLYLGFQPGGDLNDVAVLYLDTRAGGIAEDAMNDQADGGRNVASNINAPATNNTFPISADFAVAFAGFGTVVYELTENPSLDEGTPTNDHLAFVAFQDDQTTNDATIAREIALDLATLGFTDTADFFVAYGAESLFASNESIPFSITLNDGPNPGETTAITYENFNRFTTVPEPASLALVALGGVAMLGRRRSA